MANANAKSLLEMKRAVKSDDGECVRRLLADDPYLAVATGHGWTPLQDAAFQGKREALAAILHHGKGIGGPEISHALHHAFQLPNRNQATLEALLQTGLVSPLFAAMYRADEEAVAALLRSDPSLAQLRDGSGCPAIVRAAENGQTAIVALLLDHGADIEARGPHAESALSACACNQIEPKQRTKTLKYLLEQGAAVDGRTSGGRTALFSAATAGWHPEQSATVLLEHGADPNILDDAGRTALQAVLLGHTKRAKRVAMLLRQFGAAD